MIELVTSLLAQDKVSPEQAANILQQMLPPDTLSQLQVGGWVLEARAPWASSHRSGGSRGGAPAGLAAEGASARSWPAGQPTLLLSLQPSLLSLAVCPATHCVACRRTSTRRALQWTRCACATGGLCASLVCRQLTYTVWCRSRMSEHRARQANSFAVLHICCLGS